MDIRTQSRYLEEVTTIKISRGKEYVELFEEYNLANRRTFESLSKVIVGINKRDIYIDELIQNYIYFVMEFENSFVSKKNLFKPYFIGPTEEIPQIKPQLFTLEAMVGGLYTFGSKAYRALRKIKKIRLTLSDQEWLNKFKETRDLFIEQNFEVNNKKIQDLYFRTEYSMAIDTDGEIQIEIVKRKTRGIQFGYINYELDYLKTESILFKYLCKLS